MKNRLSDISEKQVRNAILKGCLFMISIFFLYVGIASIGKPEVLGILICIGMGITFNPLFVDKIMGKVLKSLTRYYDILQTVMPYLSLTVVLYLSVIVCKLGGISSDGEEFVSVVKICIYIYYVLIMFVCKDENKRKRYYKYATFYAFCIVLSFATGKVETTFINIFNFVFNVKMDEATYALLNNGCLLPLKEAMLTYIILDTAIETGREKNIQVKEL